MKILSWNVNGIRSAGRQGLLKWIKKENADIICLQELKAHEADIPGELKNIDNYFSYFNTADKKGYSGVAVYSKKKPMSVKKQDGLARFDSEGRYLELDYGKFTLINIYIPHGGRQKENLDYKLRVYTELLTYLKKNEHKNFILIGDFNIAHEMIDLARPKQNKNNIMFTEKERKQIDQLLGLGFVDTFRRFHKEGGHYTWWPWIANARERNLGWRIDYCFVSKSFEGNVQSASIQNKVLGSDHCPIEMKSSRP